MINKKITYLKNGSLLALLLSSPVTVSAASWTDRTTVSGVFSAVYSQTDDEAYYDGDEHSGINKEGSFKGSKLGITINSQVTDDLNISMLLMSSNEGKNSTNLDWGFASFALNDEFTARAGKIKLPVGLVNEYVEVGVAYPWISPPQLLYSTLASGAQATRQSYTGASMLWQGDFDDWTLGGDLFWGQVDLGNLVVNGTSGITLRANWDDIIEIQASSYQGKMITESGATAPLVFMDGKVHSAMLLGVKADWNNVIAYVEGASVKMDVTVNGNNIGDSEAWYATLGYRIGDFLPHITRQEWSRDNGNSQQTSTLGLNYSLSDSTVIKLEQSRIEVNNSNAGNKGLFNVSPENDTVNLTRVAVEVFF